MLKCGIVFQIISFHNTLELIGQDNGWIKQHEQMNWTTNNQIGQDNGWIKQHE